MMKNLRRLYCVANKKFLSEDGEILHCSSQDTYQQRKKPQVTSSNSKDAIISSAAQGIVEYNNKLAPLILCGKQKAFV
jgi:hypothetical protein